MKTTMTITTPTAKSGELAYFTIEFNKADFLTVIEEVETLKTPQDVINNTNWTVK